jgi:hypothetical protein
VLDVGLLVEFTQRFAGAFGERTVALDLIAGHRGFDGLLRVLGRRRRCRDEEGCGEHGEPDQPPAGGNAVRNRDPRLQCHRLKAQPRGPISKQGCRAIQSCFAP